MSREASELLKRALSLPEEERALLVGSLLDSLDSSPDIDVELVWQQEIARRLDELDQVRPRPFRGLRFASISPRNCDARG